MRLERVSVPSNHIPVTMCRAIFAAIFECIILVTEITEITGMTSYVIPKDSGHAGYEVELKDKGYIGGKENVPYSLYVNNFTQKSRAVQGRKSRKESNTLHGPSCL